MREGRLCGHLGGDRRGLQDDEDKQSYRAVRYRRVESCQGFDFVIGRGIGWTHRGPHRFLSGDDFGWHNWLVRTWAGFGAS